MIQLCDGLPSVVKCLDTVNSITTNLVTSSAFDIQALLAGLLIQKAGTSLLRQVEGELEGLEGSFAVPATSVTRG